MNSSRRRFGASVSVVDSSSPKLGMEAGSRGLDSRTALRNNLSYKTGQRAPGVTTEDKTLKKSGVDECAELGCTDVKRRGKRKRDNVELSHLLSFEALDVGVS